MHMGEQKKERFLEIDDIRGISIIVMILIHTNAYHLGNRLAFNLLEWSQFAVVAFIFCSSFLYFQKDHTLGLFAYWDYFKKRVDRLVFPYYGFLAGLFILMLAGEPKKLGLNYLVQNLFLTGGSENNWLVLLFLQLSLLMPLFSSWFRKSKLIMIIYTALALISSVVFLKYTPLPWFRLIMWLPWSLVVIYTMLFAKIRQRKMLFWILTGLFFLIFIGTQTYVLVPLHKSLRMYSNKYPPNIYHIAYSLFCLNILWVMAEKNLFKPLRSVIHFFSRYSYTIYFIHTLLIYFFAVILKMKFDWIGFFVIIIALTSLIQLSINKAGALLQTKQE